MSAAPDLLVSALRGPTIHQSQGTDSPMLTSGTRRGPGGHACGLRPPGLSAKPVESAGERQAPSSVRAADPPHAPVCQTGDASGTFLSGAVQPAATPRGAVCPPVRSSPQSDAVSPPRRGAG